ncbi:DNA-directed RNA polymerase-like protein [Daphnia magna]|uniref:DNA-directed RNA polymerase-like protein n=1 Tax=Daphnia magna TaxID=35525 RepID=A0A0P5DG17_9CRUS|nr:DNA-directed RNA polymerase-like protein [Daphnia magna]
MSLSMRSFSLFWRRWYGSLYMGAKDCPVDFRRDLDRIKAASHYADEDLLNHITTSFKCNYRCDPLRSLGVYVENKLKISMGD